MPLLRLAGRHAGRGEGSPVAADLAGFDGVSRAHLMLSWAGDHLLAADLDSMNGTFVNDEKITAALPVRVAGGDMIRLGGRCTLRIEPADAGSGDGTGARGR
jgi:pSer/pThr/pTyr-binding forkhead associated (FHA) protein